MKTLNYNEIMAEYKRQSVNEQRQILWNALCRMKSCNSMSKIECIANAMGYYTQDGLTYTNAA